MSLQHKKTNLPQGVNPSKDNATLNVPPRLLFAQRRMRQTRYMQAVAEGRIRKLGAL